MKRYATLLADPPWNEKGGGKIKRGADRHYPLLKTEDIGALPVQQFTADDAHLYLWTTNNHLPDALWVMQEWGFKYKTMITWAKDRIGIGQYFRGLTEHVLFGVKGNIPYRFKPDGKRAQGRTLITAPKGAHSEKPEELRAMVQVVSPGPYLELFARTKAPGWDVWGNEVPSDITMPGLWHTTERVKEFKQEYLCEWNPPDQLSETSRKMFDRGIADVKAGRVKPLCLHSFLTKHEQGDTSDTDLPDWYTCDDCDEVVVPDRCAGCSEPATRYAFCEGCYAEYREDPDAFK